jgi:sterol desaturase/sphingolipid hydroxylase (fatty acid hydroxylase superfamily)
MDIFARLRGIGALFGLMALLSLVEAAIPLRERRTSHPGRLFANLTLTLLTFATGLLLNLPLLVGFLWLQAHGFGLLNVVSLPPAFEIACAILTLDLAWYATHRTMHMIPTLWRVHAIHHSDAVVDVTTTARQHPGESVLRYLYLAAFGFAVGASPLAFAIYRIWSAVHGQFEHANIRLPQWLDTVISFAFSSPNMHKIHHSREQRFTDRNFSNLFSIWDRPFGTFTPSRHGRAIHYGLDGCEGADRQSFWGLLVEPLRRQAGSRTPRGDATSGP